MNTYSNVGGTDRAPIGTADQELADFMETIREHVPDASDQEIQATSEEAKDDAMAMQSCFMQTEKVLQILANRTVWIERQPCQL